MNLKKIIPPAAVLLTVFTAVLTVTDCRDAAKVKLLDKPGGYRVLQVSGEDRVSSDSFEPVDFSGIASDRPYTVSGNTLKIGGCITDIKVTSPAGEDILNRPFGAVPVYYAF